MVYGMGKFYDNFILNCKNAKKYCDGERKKRKQNDFSYIKNNLYSLWIYDIFFKPSQNYQKQQKYNNGNGNGFY